MSNIGVVCICFLHSLYTKHFLYNCYNCSVDQFHWNSIYLHVCAAANESVKYSGKFVWPPTLAATFL